MSYTPKERAIMELAWDEIDDFNDFCDTYYENNKEAIREIASSNLRIPTALTPFETFNNRKHQITDLSTEEILSALPDAYFGPNYEKGLYSNLCFRSWHFVTYSSFTIPDLHSLPDVLWVYKVKAQTNYKTPHYHCLVEFIFAHPKEYVMNLFRLPSYTKLDPIHHSILDAKLYLDNQAIETEEYGQMPTHRIWTSSKNIEISPMHKFEAASEGEDPIYLSNFMGGLPIGRLNKYISWVRTQNFSKNRIFVRNNKKAIEMATKKSQLYNGRIYVLNCKSILSPFTNTFPPDYGGEHVVVLLNMDPEMNLMFDDDSWLNVVPYVYYTRIKD